MEKPKRRPATIFESLISAEAKLFHAALTALLRTKGDRGKLGDAQYYTLATPGHHHEAAIISNYFTRIVHKAYKPSDDEDLSDLDQQLSLSNNDAVIDIDFPDASYVCFRPEDIRPERAYWLKLSPTELASFPQDHYVLIGPQGPVDIASHDVAQILATNIGNEVQNAE